MGYAAIRASLFHGIEGASPASGMAVVSIPFSLFLILFLYSFIPYSFSFISLLLAPFLYFFSLLLYF